MAGVISGFRLLPTLIFEIGTHTTWSSHDDTNIYGAG